MPVSLLTHDPQPSVVLDAAGTPLTVNPALSRLLAGTPLAEVRKWLPGNIDELVRACLQQGRAIEQVQAEFAEHLWLWTLIPIPESQCVVARGREASAELLAGREALLSLSSRPPLNLGEQIRALKAYPYGCSVQNTCGQIRFFLLQVLDFFLHGAAGNHLVNKHRSKTSRAAPCKYS